VYQQLTGSPGNLGEIFHYFRTSTEPSHTLLQGWRLVAAQFTVDADWITGARPITFIEPAAIQENPFPVLLVAFVVATWFAWRRWRPLRELATVLVLTMVFGIIGLSRTLGPMYDYRLRWIWVVAGLCTAFVLAVVYRSVAALHARRAAAGIAVAAGVGMVVLTVIGSSHLAGADPYRAEALRTDVIARGIIEHVPAKPGVVLLRAVSYGAYIAVAGTMLRLDEAGIPAQYDRHDVQARRTFGSQRIHGDAPVRAIVVLANGDAIATVRALPGARRVAFASGSLGRPHDRRSRAEIHNDDLAAFTVPIGSARSG
jgi:hypothetical protein